MLQIEESKRVLYALEDAGPSGKGMMVLSNECGIDLEKLRDYLQAEQDYFVQLDGGPSYTLNRFGRFRGSVEAMVAHLREQESEKKGRRQLLVVFLLGLYFGSQIEEVAQLIMRWWHGTLV